MPILSDKDLQDYAARKQSLQQEQEQERRKMYPGWYKEKERREKEAQESKA